MMGSSSIVEWSVCVYVWSLMVLFVTAEHHMKICTRNMKNHPQGICGSHIDEALSVFCGKGGFVEKHHKRSVQASSTNDDDAFLVDMSAKDALDLYKQNELGLPSDTGLDEDDVVIKRSKAITFLDKRVPFFTSGVACECCYNVCSVPEMQAYCKRPVSIRSRFGFGF